MIYIIDVVKLLAWLCGLAAVIAWAIGDHYRRRT